MNELPDTPEALEAKETASKVPLGWWVLYFGLIAWGIYYAWTYTPSLGGWSQDRAFEESTKVAAAVAGESGANIFATVLFTALATLAAVVLVVAAARRKPAKR
jgi:hypothetical protein